MGVRVFYQAVDASPALGDIVASVKNTCA